MVDGEVVADEEEVAELDVLLSQQALTPSDLPHLGQDLKPITIRKAIISVSVCHLHGDHEHCQDEPAQRQHAWPPRRGSTCW